MLFIFLLPLLFNIVIKTQSNEKNPIPYEEANTILSSKQRQGNLTIGKENSSGYYKKLYIHM